MHLSLNNVLLFFKTLSSKHKSSFVNKRLFDQDQMTVGERKLTARPSVCPDSTGSLKVGHHADCGGTLCLAQALILGLSPPSSWGLPWLLFCVQSPISSIP